MAAMAMITLMVVPATTPFMVVAAMM